MHISKLQLVNYRNFDRATVHFAKGINTIIGENGSGKSNLFRAMRLLLDDTLIRAALKLEEKDFHRGLKDWRGHWIVISMEFDDVSQDEAIQALFLHGTGNVSGPKIGKATYNLVFRPKAAVRLKLSELKPGDVAALNDYRKTITIADYETTFMGKSTANFADPAEYKALVGDFEAVVFPKELTSPKLGGQLPNLLSVKTEVCFTYIQALRDVVAEFQNNRTNPLLALLRSKSGDINAADFAKITKLVKDLNTGIEALPDVEGVKDDIRDTIVEAAGETYSPRSLSIRSDLSDEADRLFQSLKLFVGESDEAYEGPIHELSLGGANLIFLTLKLLEFHYQKAKQSFANFLVIEEPEAHIHTHIQKTLFDKLDYTDTQVIYSTHSTHISEVSNVERINILARRGQVCEVFQPAAGLGPIEVRNIQRYLDAVRSNLLFAKSVLLVEGDAEEIVIPALIKKVLGLSLDELGISLINIRSTGFANVAVLFHDLRIRKRCGIITDRDAPFFDTKPAASDTPAAKALKEDAVASAKSGAEREAALAALVKSSGWLSAHFAPHTFEVDLLLAGNQDAFLRALPRVYKDATTLAAASTDLKSNDAAQAGGRALRMANHLKKGWFAVLLASEIDEGAIIPEYILEAVFSAHRPISKTSICAVVEHRRALNLASGKLTEATLDLIDVSLKQFKEDKIDIPTLHAMFLACFPNDPVQAAFNYFSAA